MAAFDSLHERRGATLDRVAARLVERLLRVDVAVDLLAVERAEGDARRRDLGDGVPSQQIATAVRTWCVRPDRRVSMRTASASSFGLPNILSSSTTSVSAPSTVAERVPRCSIRCQPTVALVRAAARRNGARARRRARLR
jgi:hypothetical protein